MKIFNTMKQFLSILILTFFLTLNVNAQSSSIINTTADVQATLTTAVVNDLDFGTVQVRNSKTILPDDINAGKVEILGGRGLSVQIDFTLPAELTNGNGDTLPITFGTNSAGYNKNNNGTNVTFNPSNGHTNTLHNNDGAGYVFIGGTVNATDPATVIGNYIGEIEVTVNYN